jgi:amino acid transporter
MAAESGLRRSLSLIDVVALGLNGVIGSGIFFLPGLAAGFMGPASVLTMGFAAVLAFLIALCFAEVGSRYSGTGGAYLYALEVHGDAVGFFIGWINCGITIVAWAALVNVLADAVGYFIPALGDPSLPLAPPFGDATGVMSLRAALIVGVMLVLTLVNLGGAKLGARVANVFTAAKLVPLVAFIAIGLFFIDGGRFSPFAPRGFGNFFDATLLIFYAFVGFEALVVPAGEMSRPQRMVPLSLLIVLGVVTGLYLLVQVVTTGTLAELAGNKTPVADASQAFLGPIGATLIAAGIVISIAGVNAGAALVGPRRFYALAENGHLPPALAATNTRGVPAMSIWLVFGLSAVVALSGSFRDLALISVVGRFAQYISTAAAALVLRLRERGAAPRPDRFSLPLGPTIPILAIALSVLVLSQSEPRRLAIGALAVASGVPVYLYIYWRRRKLER